MQELEKYTIPELILHVIQRLYDTDKVKNRARFGMLNAYIRQFERAHIPAASAIIMPARFGKYVKPATKQPETVIQEVDSFEELYQSDMSETSGYVTDAPISINEIPPIETMEDETAPATTKRGRKKTPSVRRKKKTDEEECCG